MVGYEFREKIGLPLGLALVRRPESTRAVLLGIFRVADAVDVILSSLFRRLSELSALVTSSEFARMMDSVRNESSPRRQESSQC